MTARSTREASEPTGPGTGPGRTGRRPGESGTREAILDAARRSFARAGYEATSIRGIARDAGVDPALVHHFFGTKDRLFAEALALPVNPADVVELVLAEGAEGVGERVVRTFLTVWGRLETREPLLALVRSAVTNDHAAEMLRGFVADAFGRVAERLGLPDAQLRATLVGSHLVGLGLARYVVHIEPLASADDETVVAWVAPAIQRYLTGQIESAGGSPESPARSSSS